MPLTSSQKRDVLELQGIISTSKRDAEMLLRTNQWSVQAAANSYFAAHQPDPATLHGPALSKLFDQIRGAPGENPDIMYIDATMQYLSELGVPLDSIAVLVFFTILQCNTMGEVPRQGFIDGWAAHEALTVAAQKQTLDKLTADLQAKPALSRPPADSLSVRVYKHTFQVALPAGARSVPLEMATEYWKLLFGEQAGAQWHSKSTPWLDWFISYLETRYKKSVNRDFWNQALRFAQETLLDDDMSFWSEESAWPGVVDGFVGYVHDQRKRDPNSMETD